MNDFLKKLCDAKCWVKDFETVANLNYRMDEKFQKNQFIQNHSKANSAVAILS